jgi:hypothetical protein
MTYIFEVQKFIRGKRIHIGFMNKVFNSKEEAGLYYDTFNPHMRQFTHNKTWRSDWDTNSKLMFIVRKKFTQKLTLPCFDDMIYN